VNLARELLGVVSHENRSGGVLVTTAGVSRGIRALAASNHRIDYVEGSSLVRLLDEHLGPRWVTQIDRLVHEPT
jgi:restriction endonuclease Mrr